MKAKLKFDKKAILGFFANNGEKLLFAGVVLGFLFFVYRAVGRERFDKTPQDLAAEAENAARHIGQCDPKVATKGVDPGPLIEAVSAPIKGDPYEFITVLNPPPIPPLSKRGEPVLYTVEGLRATPGLGRFSDRAGMPGMGGMGMGGMAGMGAPPAEGGATVGPDGMPLEDLGKRWVVLTGLVNYEKLMKSFWECYKDVATKFPQNDVPQFVYYTVERAEITDPRQDPSTLKWERPYENLKTQIRLYSSMGASEIVDSYFLDPVLTFPLPPRADRPWGDEVAHAPEIPVLDLTSQGGYENIDPTQPREGEDGPDEPMGGLGPGGMMGGGMMGGGMMGEGGMPGAGARMGGRPMGSRGMGGMAPGMEGMAPGMMGPGGSRRPSMGMGGMGMGGMGMGGMGMGMGGMGMGMAGQQQQVSPYVLFRFFDYKVEPGKRYRYRVQIWVNNPNWQVPAEYVNAEVRERMQDKKNWKQYLRSAWSEPSDVVAVPRDDRLLVVEVNPSLRTDGEATSKIMAIHWDVKEGIEIADEFDVRPGQLVNILDQKIPEPPTLQGAPGAPGALGAPGGPGAPGTRGTRGTRGRGGEGPAMGPGMGMEGMMPGGPGMGPGMGGPGMGGPGDDGGRRGARTNPRRTGRAAPGAAAQPFKPAEEQKIDYRTEMLVLDIDGGGTLPGKNRDLAWPGEMLLLTPDGELAVRSDVEDHDDYVEQKNMANSLDPMQGLGGRGGMMGGGMGMPGMEPGMGPGPGRRAPGMTQPGMAPPGMMP